MNEVSPPGDDLSEVLARVNVRSVVYCLSDLGAPWGFQVPSSPEPKFHLVLRGAAVLQTDGEDVELSTGDVVLLPRGDAHAVRDRPTSRAPRLERVLARHPLDDGRLTYGGTGTRTLLLCGSFSIDDAADGLLEYLPQPAVLEAPSQTLGHWFEPLVALLDEPTAAKSAGSAAVFAKIADVFLTDVLRHYLSEIQPLQASPSALTDPAIAESLRILRADLSAPWTVAELARRVGMSRTSFTSRFRSIVGHPPMSYLRRLRLAHGAGQLTTSKRTVAEIARAAGFSDEAAFSKAFKRRYGAPPGAYRATFNA